MVDRLCPGFATSMRFVWDPGRFGAVIVLRFWAAHNIEGRNRPFNELRSKNTDLEKSAYEITKLSEGY